MARVLKLKLNPVKQKKKRFRAHEQNRTCSLWSIIFPPCDSSIDLI